MAITYPTAVKTARLNAVKTALGSNGKLEIGTNAMALILSEHDLGAGGSVTNDVWTIISSNNTDAANNSGTARSARIRTSGATDIVTGLTVGLSAAAAPAWAGSTAYTVGQFRTNGANQYRCVTAGTSAASGGPTGTGTGITDGTAVWDFVCVANADVLLDNVLINAGQNVTVSSAAITHAA